MSVTSKNIVPTHVRLSITEGAENINGIQFMKNNVPYYVIKFKNKFAPLSRELSFVVKAQTIVKGEKVVYPEDRAEAIKLAKTHGFMMPNEVLPALKTCADANESALVQFIEDDCSYEIEQPDGTMKEVNTFNAVYANGTPKSVFIKEMETRGIQLNTTSDTPVEQDEKEQAKAFGS